MFELKMTEQQAIDGLKDLYGTEFTTIRKENGEYLCSGTNAK